MKTFLLIALCLIKQLIMQNICNLSFFFVPVFLQLPKMKDFSLLYSSIQAGGCAGIM